MKKVLSLCVACLLLVGMFAVAGFSASAASPKESIIAAAKAAIPSKYEKNYLATMENVLQQIDVTEAQAEAVIANINAAKAAVQADKGASLSEYTPAEVQGILDNFDAACTTLGLTYKLVPAENPQHEGDVDCQIFLANGQQIASLNGDVVKKTNAPESGMAFAALAGVLVLAAVAAAVYSKKLAASR